MKKTLIQLLVVVAMYNAAYSQKYNGYVITDSDSDSLIKGYMTLQNSKEGIGRKISLYSTRNMTETPQVFYTLKVKEYAFKRDTFKVLTNLHLIATFSGGALPPLAEAKVIVSGRLNLYQVGVEKGTIYLSPPTGMTRPVATPNIVKVFFIEDHDGYTYEVNKENFTTVMKDVLKGAPELSAKIELKELKYKDLKSIAREYNGMSIDSPKKNEGLNF